MFFGLLPLLNAVFDYASYVVTLTLIRRRLRAGWGAVFVGLTDLIITGVLLMLSGASILLAVAGAHVLAGVTLYPLDSVFDDILMAPDDYWWLYLMLFSSVLPTMAHFAAATFSLSALARPSWRQRLVGWIEGGDGLERTLAPLAVAALWLASLAVPLALLWGAFWLIGAFGYHPVSWYLDLMEGFARWLGQL